MLLLALLALLLYPSFATADGSAGSGKVTLATATGRASLVITSLEPLSVTGRGFKPAEHVTVRFESRRKATTATSAGRFVVRLAGVDCNGGTIVAVGSKGSRAVAHFSQLLCVAP